MEDDIKYCVSAFIDLLGFSNHLEVSSNDLRTTIGQEAIKRLSSLEESIAKIEEEMKINEDFFPKSFYYQRINDGLILSIDLPNFLKPAVGEPHKSGWSVAEFEQYFDIEELPTDEDAIQAFTEKIDESVDSLCKFVGMIARVHNFINNQENRSYFPGAKTVIATGYRKVFINRNGAEDFLAANFSFSNAYKAELMLHGPKFYIDCYVLQLLLNNRYARNIIKSALFVSNTKPMDPFIDSKDYYVLDTEYNESVPILLNLFHKPYYFREINSARLSYLQRIPAFTNYMKEHPDHVNNEKIWKHSFSYIIIENVDKDTAREAFLINCDITFNIKKSFDLLLFGKSQEKEKEFLLTNSYLNI